MFYTHYSENYYERNTMEMMYVSPTEVVNLAKHCRKEGFVAGVTATIGILAIRRYIRVLKSQAEIGIPTNTTKER